jgi:predicted dehydrogenase
LELAAVVERGTNNATERYPGIVTYRSIDAMLEDSSLGLFVVTTPSGTHFEIARQILEAGKNVVVDKPMCVASAEIAELMNLAAARNVLLAAFHNRRYDSDFLTLQKLLHEDFLGRLVYFESNYDRWRPTRPTNRLWKESRALGGGILLDLGTHLVDEVLVLFGKPEAVSAEVKRERDGEGADDFFSLRLRYPRLEVVVAGNNLSSLERARFHLRGTKGNYWKWGMDVQEAALLKIATIGTGPWVQEPSANWGTLKVDVDGGTVTRPVTPLPGDYRLYYAGIRDALLGKAPVPVTALAAWRAARLLEWAVESSEQRREIVCDWSGEPSGVSEVHIKGC